MIRRPSIRLTQLLLVVVLVGLDWGSKYWAQSAAATTDGPTPILPFISLVLAYNPGLTFGGLLGISRHPFLGTLLGAGIIVVLLLWFWRERRTARQFFIAFALAGSIGNGIDRALNTMVTDFLQLNLGGSSLLVVNLADVWVCVGILGLLASGGRGNVARSPDRGQEPHH